MFYTDVELLNMSKQELINLYRHTQKKLTEVEEELRNVNNSLLACTIKYIPQTPQDDKWEYMGR